MYDDRDTGKEWRGTWGAHVSMHVWGREGKGVVMENICIFVT